MKIYQTVPRKELQVTHKHINCSRLFSKKNLSQLKSCFCLFFFFLFFLFFLFFYPQMLSKTKARRRTSFLQPSSQCYSRSHESPCRMPCDWRWEVVCNKVDTCWLIRQDPWGWWWKMRRSKCKLWEVGSLGRMHEEPRVYGWIVWDAWLLQEELQGVLARVPFGFFVESSCCSLNMCLLLAHVGVRLHCLVIFFFFLVFDVLYIFSSCLWQLLLYFVILSKLWCCFVLEW